MKKLKLSVAALSIAMSGFCTNPTTEKELIQEMSMTVEDIIQSMRIGIVEDKFNGLPVEMAKIYIHNLLDVLSKLEDIQVLDRAKINCENCDETD